MYKSEKIDVDILQMMKLSHIRLLLYNFPLGIQIRFEYNLEQWRKDIGRPFQLAVPLSDNQFATMTTERNFKDEIFQNNLEKNEIQTDVKNYNSNTITQTNQENNIKGAEDAGDSVSEDDPLKEINLTAEQLKKDKSTTFKTPQTTTTNVDLRTILLHSESGLGLIKNYRFRRRFSNTERRLLISIIVKYHLDYNLEFNKQISYALERDITKMFRTEMLSFYRTSTSDKIYKSYIKAKTARGQEGANYVNQSNTHSMNNVSRVHETNNEVEEYPFENQLMNEDYTTNSSIKSNVSHFEKEYNESIASDNNTSVMDFIKVEPEVISDTSSVDSMALAYQTYKHKLKQTVECERPFKSFRIPWHKLPSEIINLLENKQPLGKGLNVIANLIVDELRCISTHIPLRIFRLIAQQAINKYPHAFLDKDSIGRLNPLSTTTVPLLSRMRNRNNNLNREKNLAKIFLEEEIDISTLTIMKLSHIKSLLSGFTLGIQIRFEHNLEQWRQRIGRPLKSPANNEIIRYNEFNVSRPTQEHLKADINLKEILMKCQPEGPELLDIYRDKQTFSNPERNFLIELIINYYLRNDLAFDLYISYDLENAICSLFPNETLDQYRKSKEGKIYVKYLAAKAKYQNKECNMDNDVTFKRDEELTTESVKRLKKTHEASQNNMASDSTNDNKNINSTLSTGIPTEILLQTVYNDCKKFVKILQPFVYKDFFSAVCSTFNIVKRRNFYAAINECEISENDFKNIILQYYKLPTFCIELKERVNHALDAKLEHVENTCSQADFYTQSSPYPAAKTFNANENHNTTVQIIVNHLPDANDIRNIPSLLPIVKMSDDGRPLENKHRTTIAKAIIDECLNFQPERVLKRQDFFTLTDNLIQAFPNEIASAYFIPSQPNHAARGKLWNAYNNKRSFLGSSGIVQRRQHNNAKRKHQSDEDEGGSERTNDKVYHTDNAVECKDFAINSILDWDTLQQKWSDSHQERRKELLRDKMPPQYYMQKYSILKSNRGIDLMEIDVNILHPTVVNINNWLALHEKVIEMGRKLQKIEQLPRLLENINSSNDEKYRASLALLILPYIFPYNARRNEFNEKASKVEIQNRFIKEFASLDDLRADTDCADLQIRFVHFSQQINYAEFKICGHIFKCVDLLEALSSLFHYTVALNIEYPKICLHIWQFIQLAIFQIEIQGYKQPNVESIINDLYMI
ncbi:uncharacterized protein LOC111686549 [Lucilia cuprina]|uniref:uncharacterized protein LOC111686549 n=1 Tax=Lucilia cuprina TaxID=7375 RepID=UPI001F068889|nr:uncharacterized protein LOC111686549 [Lucilia cuprina]